METGLEGRVIMITGGAKGIGLSTAEAFAREGSKVGIVDVDEAACHDAVAKLSAQGAEAVALPADVTDRDYVDRVTKQLSSKFGSADVLVNNAGYPRDSYLTRMPEADWDAVIDVILKGAFNCCRAVLPAMYEKSFGRVINIASRAHLGNPGQTNYSAAKSGLIGFTRALALESGRFNVTANAVSPGLTETPGLRSLENYERIRDRALSITPLPRVGVPEDIANAVIFLASDQGSYITGENLHVTGGRYA